jgi:DNA-binding CsgD family transcriptional regulator
MAAPDDTAFRCVFQPLTVSSAGPTKVATCGEGGSVVGERIADIERARDALGRESWREAYDVLTASDPADLTPPDLEGLADAAWWLSHTDESVAARQRAYAGYAESGEDARAAYMAGRLGVEHFMRGEPAVGAGWLMRAHRHLDGLPDCVEHGFLAIIEATVARFGGDLDRAHELATKAAEIGRRFRNPDVLALAVHTNGLISIAEGREAEGVAMLDEAMTAVVAGELTSYFTGVVYCNVIGACLELADVRRAGEWSEAARAWCESLPPESPYPGLCRINRAEVARLRGAWAEAEAEALRASEELMSFDPMASASALYEAGEIRRRTGNDAGAEEAFARARELGFEPQPGLALLRLAQGKVEAAQTSLRLAVTGDEGNSLRRARLLAAQVYVALAAREPETARTARDELALIARDSGRPALAAAAASANATLRLAEGDLSGALESSRRAGSIWQELKLPYEAAHARLTYGLALRASGGEEDARSEMRAALASFERLGASPDARRTADLLSTGRGLPRGLSPREAEVLRLLATGKTNREIAAALVISEHTVARHLQNMFLKLGVSSRSAATAFAFEHDLA